MKEKIKNFLVEKKELMIFMGIVGLIFIAVLTVASLALQSESDPVIDIPNDNPDITDVLPPNEEDTTKVSTFLLPVLSDAIKLRCYYDLSKSEDELISASIKYGQRFIESKGITYVSQDNEELEVSAIYDGTVTSVKEDEIHGFVVAIKHSDDIISYYSSLSSVNVKENDQIKQGTIIGISGINLFDTEASNHVSLEIKVNGYYVDPELVFNQTLNQVSELVKEGK